MRAYSLDLRQRVMKAHDEGKWTVGQIAERFKVGEINSNDSKRRAAALARARARWVSPDALVPSRSTG